MMTYIQETLLNLDDETFFRGMEKQGVTRKILQQKMQRIKDWYKFQPHLPQDKLDDSYLMRHLSMNKYDEEKTKKKIDALFSARTFFPEYFNDRNPSSPRISKKLESLDTIIMPTRTEEDYRIVILKFNIDSHVEYDMVVGALCGFIISDIRMRLDSSAGDIYIWDLEHATFDQIKQVHLPSLARLIYIIQMCYGAVIQGIHIINAPAIAELAMSVAKAALSKKISERFMVHYNMESFRKALPMKYLPKEMGGDVPMTLKEIANQWDKALKTPEIIQWFRDLDEAKSDESKRLNKKDFVINDMVGVRGTFRKLELD